MVTLRIPPAFTAVLAIVGLVSLATVRAQAPSQVIDQIEEDWKLVVGTPDPAGVGPQITTCLSPVSDGSTPFVAFDLNYCEFPKFAPGGMQLQVWDDKKVLDTATKNGAVFSTDDEVVTWTQRMSIGGGKASYAVRQGNSTTWGQFGGDNDALTVSFPTSLSDLSLYRPDTSASKSGASWESNRVASLTLVQVRYYSGGQLVRTDTTPRTVVTAAQED